MELLSLWGFSLWGLYHVNQSSRLGLSSHYYFLPVYFVLVDISYSYIFTS